MDPRFCAVCQRAGGGLDEILRFLSSARIRATDAAVSAVLGVPARSLGPLLGARGAEAAWVVRADNGLPAGSAHDEWPHDLLSDPTIIRTGTELTLRLTLWRAKTTKPFKT